MNEITAMESIRIAARRGAAFASLVGPVVAQAIPPIKPAMISAYRGAFEGAA